MEQTNMANGVNAVEGVARQMKMYLESARKLTHLVDYENQLLLFEHTETEALRDQERQAQKHALFARVETLARIITRTLQVKRPEEAEELKKALVPIDSLRRSLRLNSLLLEMCMERQENRLRHIMRLIEGKNHNTPEMLVPEKSHVADHSA